MGGVRSGGGIQEGGREKGLLRKMWVTSLALQTHFSLPRMLIPSTSKKQLGEKDFSRRRRRRRERKRKTCHPLSRS